MRAPLVATVLVLASCHDASSAIPTPVRDVEVVGVASVTRAVRVPRMAVRVEPTIPRAVADDVVIDPAVCERGQVVLCPEPWPDPTTPLRMRCVPGPKGWRFNIADCATPLVVAFDDVPVRFTRPAGGVASFGETEWVSSHTPWLARDVDGSGCIEDRRELFGPWSHGAAGDVNGFAALARLDDDHDHRIDAHDAAYPELVLWYDRDQDRACAPHELMSLAAAGVTSIDLAYASSTSTVLGSYEGEHAGTWFRRSDGSLSRGRVIDVYLAPLSP